MADLEDETADPVDQVLWTAVGVEAALGVVAVVLGFTLGPDARALIPPATMDYVAPLLGGIGLGVLATLPLLAFVALVRRIPHPAIRELDELSGHPMISQMLKLGPTELFVISLCAGVGEELLFRGWMMPLLAGASSPLALADEVQFITWYAPGGWLNSVTRTDGMGWWQWWTQPGGIELFAAWVASSIVFGLFHPITRIYIVLTAVIGLYLGLLLILTGNLLVPITAHALYDAIQLWGASRESKKIAAATGPVGR